MLMRSESTFYFSRYAAYRSLWSFLFVISFSIVARSHGCASTCFSHRDCALRKSKGCLLTPWSHVREHPVSPSETWAIRAATTLNNNPIRITPEQDNTRQSTRQDLFRGCLTFASSWFAFCCSQPGWSKDVAPENGRVIPDECRNGALVTESAVPGAYQQVCMSLPERSITLKSTGEVLVIQQGSGAGAGRTGVAVWNSCLLLTRLLDVIAVQASDNWLEGKTVLELGCGTGLACIAAAKLGTASVIATDGNPDVVALARANAERNHVSKVMTTRTLSWGLMNAMDNAEVADVVIGSDLTYNSGSWRVLAETVGTVLKPNGLVLYLSLGHSGFDVRGELNGFLSVAKSEGLEILSEGGDDWPLPVPSVSKLLDQGITIQERDVLEATGGIKVVVLRKTK